MPSGDNFEAFSVFEMICRRPRSSKSCSYVSSDFYYLHKYLGRVDLKFYRRVVALLLRSFAFYCFRKKLSGFRLVLWV